MFSPSYYFSYAYWPFMFLLVGIAYSCTLLLFLLVGFVSFVCRFFFGKNSVFRRYTYTYMSTINIFSSPPQAFFSRLYAHFLLYRWVQSILSIFLLELVFFTYCVRNLFLLVIFFPMWITSCCRIIFLKIINCFLIGFHINNLYACVCFCFGDVFYSNYLCPSLCHDLSVLNIIVFYRSWYLWKHSFSKCLG